MTRKHIATGKPRGGARPGAGRPKALIVSTSNGEAVSTDLGWGTSRSGRPYLPDGVGVVVRENTKTPGLIVTAEPLTPTSGAVALDENEGLQDAVSLAEAGGEGYRTVVDGDGQGQRIGLAPAEGSSPRRLTRKSDPAQLYQAKDEVREMLPAAPIAVRRRVEQMLDEDDDLIEVWLEALRQLKNALKEVTN